MIIEAIKSFSQAVARGEIEVYNEFSLQHEIGIFLRNYFSSEKIQFERNITFFGFPKKDFIKREIDISVFSPNQDNLRCAIELKFPRNGQYPEQMYSFCKDIVFAEQLKKAGFQQAYLIIFADDPLFYQGSGHGIYGYFRKSKRLHGTVTKPKGRRILRWRSLEHTLFRGTKYLEIANTQ